MSKDNFQGVELSVCGNVIYLPLTTVQKRFKHPSLSSELNRIKLELEPGISLVDGIGIMNIMLASILVCCSGFIRQ